MRGRAKDPARQHAKSSHHAKYGHYCTCGKVVYGNGGKTSHKAMHERRDEWQHRGDLPNPPSAKHTYISMDAHRTRFPELYHSP